MKTNLRAVLFLVIVTLAVSSPCVLAHTNITAQQARDLIDSTSDLVIVDVREPYEYCDDRGHIPGALNYPWSSGILQARYEELPMDGPVLVVCRSGVRSNQAANFLDSKGFSMVYDMLGGMGAWEWETAPCKYAGGNGTAEDPYQIATAEDLIALGNEPNDYDKHFILTADIDLDPNLPGGVVFDRAVIAPDTNDFERGFQGSSFTGVFDGDGHTILNLGYNSTGTDYIGLFGYIDDPNAIIKNLGLIDPNIDIHTANFVGSLVGGIRYGIIINCYAVGGKVSGCNLVGGLVGYSYAGSITNCYTNCDTSGNYSVGGLLGYSEGLFNHETIFIEDKIIYACYTSGKVTGDHSVGGLVGDSLSLFANISNCYSNTSVTGRLNVGGLVGGIFDIEGIVNCYSTGAVFGQEMTGGLVGHSPLWEGNVAASFWDTETAGQTKSAGGIGLTTVEMQTAGTFLDAVWDFVCETANGTEDIWYIAEEGYPHLVWELEEAPLCPGTVIELDETNFSDGIAHGVVLVDFYATWCSHCSTQAQILDEVAEQVGREAIVAKLDVDKARSVAQIYGVTAIPTLIVFKDGSVFKRFVGVTQAPILVAAIQAAIGY